MAVCRYFCSLHFIEERLRGEAKSLCNLYDVQEGDVPFAAFDHADIVTVQARQFSELLLGELAGEPEASKFISKLSFWVGRHTSTFKGIAVWGYTL